LRRAPALLTSAEPPLKEDESMPTMQSFPEFMKNPANRIATAAQNTPGVEDYVFDGIDGSQMAFWSCPENAVSAAHMHEYDEYMIVVEGCYTVIVNGERIPVRAGEEYFFPRGTLQSGEVLAGTRTIHAFGGHRADRM
jgi:mannose-6-phosphate isomerase-like protein (cupin superfamily)